MSCNIVRHSIQQTVKFLKSLCYAILYLLLFFLDKEKKPCLSLSPFMDCIVYPKRSNFSPFVSFESYV